MRLIIVSFFLVLILGGCGSSQPQLAPLSTDATILAFGDSLTHGSGVNKEKSYPSQLEKIIDRKIINAGIPGELSADGLARLPALLDQHKPDMMILIHGGNDLLRKKDLRKTADSLRAMIKQAQNRGIDVVMMAVPNPTLILSPAGFYETVASDMRVPVEINAIADILQYPSNKSDAVHPNANGYLEMAKRLKALLEDTGSL